MSYGAKVPGRAAPSAAQGFQLLAKTVQRVHRHPRFDAGALLTFNGLRALTDEVGGIDLYVDTTSSPSTCGPTEGPGPSAAAAHTAYGGPQMTYNVGNRHLVGWQALDYSRQRYLPGGDYTRQRHQRQVIRAIIAKIVNTDLSTNPAAVLKILKGLHGGWIFDGRGRQPAEFAYALRNLRPATLTLIGLPGNGAYSGGSYIGENLDGIQATYFAALRQDKLADYVPSHPNLVNS